MWHWIGFYVTGYHPMVVRMVLEPISRPIEEAAAYFAQHTHNSTQRIVICHEEYADAVEKALRERIERR